MAVTDARFVCGAECGIAVVGALGPGVEHWGTVSGAVSVVTSGPASMLSTRCYRVNPTAADAYLEATYGTAVPTTATHVGRFKVYFATLPTVKTFLAQMLGSAANGSIVYNLADSKLYAATAAGTLGATGVAVTTGVWYRVDWKVVSGATITTDVQIDGVACGQASVAGSAGTATGFRLGLRTFATAPTGDVYFDDVIASGAAADYPIGDGTVAGLYPASDGTHGGTWAAGVFKKGSAASVNAARTDTDIWQSLQNPLSTTIPTNFVGDITGVVTTDYVEFVLGNLPAGATGINGANVVATLHAATTTASNHSLNLSNTAGSSASLFSLAFNLATITVPNVVRTTDAAGAAWDVTKINDARIRFSSTDSNPDVFLDGVCMEVDYTSAAAASRTATDSLFASDAATRATLSLARTASDALFVSDAATKLGTFARSAADVLFGTDVAVAQAGKARTATDTLLGGDVATRGTLSFSRTATDSLTGADAATRTSPRTRSATDTLLGTDTAVRSVQSFSRTATDTALGGDVATRTTTRSRTASDALLGTDTATSQAGKARTATDTLLGTDTATRAAQSFSRTATDALLVSDAATRTLILSRTATDSLIGTDVATSSFSPGSGSFSRTATDALLVSDAAARTSPRTRTATDSLLGADSTTRAALAFSRTASDKLTGTATPFPSGIANLGAWWDSDDATKVADTAGVISTVTDKSANARNLTATGTVRINTRTLNGKRMFDLSGVAGNYLQGPSGLNSPVERTAFAVVIFDVNDPTCGPVIGSTGTGWSWRRENSNTPTRAMEVLDEAVAHHYPTGASQVSNGTPHLLSVRWTRTGYTLRLDGVVNGTNSNSYTPGTAGNITVGEVGGGGAPQVLDGAIGEPAFFDRALSDAEWDQVEAHYLSTWLGIGGDDVATRFVVLPRAVSDTLLGADVATSSFSPGAGSFSRTATDTLLGGDVATRLLVATRTTADGLLGSDTASRTTIRPRTATDALLGSDVATRLAVYSRTGTDTLLGTDAATRTRTSIRTTADALFSGDVATRNIALVRSGTDALLGADLAATGGSPIRVASDSLLGSDVATRNLALVGRTTTDSLLGGDAATRTSSRTRTATDVLLGGDVATRTTTRLRTAADALLGTDTATRTSSRNRTTTDSLLGTDSATTGTGGTARAATDALLGSDVASRTSTRSRSVTDALLGADAASPTSTRTRTAADALLGPDVAVRTVRTSRNAADALLGPDAATVIRGFVRAVSDVLLGGDVANRAPQLFARLAVDALLGNDTAVAVLTGAQAPTLGGGEVYLGTSGAGTSGSGDQPGGSAHSAFPETTNDGETRLDRRPGGTSGPGARPGAAVAST